MKLSAKTIRLSATDLGNHLACRHVTALDLRVARGEKQEPAWAAPDLAVIQQLGQQHEAAYLDYLAKQQGIAVTNLTGIKSETTLVERNIKTNVARRRSHRPRRLDRREMVWPPRRPKARRQAQPQMELVLRSSRHQACTGNKSRHNFANLSLLRALGKSAGIRTRNDVGHPPRK